jgi:homogentisate 1,2-dioxygenase
MSAPFFLDLSRNMDPNARCMHGPSHMEFNPMSIQYPSTAAATGIESAIRSGYMSGFGNGFETEALPGALPLGRNSPQRCAYGLYAEQISGSPFTAPRKSNERSWLYRVRPTVRHWGKFVKVDVGLWRTAPAVEVEVPIAPMRWDPIPIPEERLSFVEGVRTMTTAGDAGALAGMGAHVYLVTRSMVDEYFYNADGEMLLVPQQGELRLCTEFGVIDIGPGEVAVIQRGVKIRVELRGAPARGYLCENYGGAFTLPERGPIGANCLANPRDFLTPVAAFEDKDAPSLMYVKWGGSLWRAEIGHSPLDAVAWHGNYAPYKYDLRRYSPVGPVLYDHADPSIFTVLTSPSETPGTANIDFVIFPDRWLVAENTFRPPWYHMNVMSEFMGLIYGQYDAKMGSGFVPGGASLHNTMLPHGPDADAFERASHVELKPHRLEGTLAFMFETRFPQRVTRFAAEGGALQQDYGTYGHGLAKRFDPTRP